MTIFSGKININQHTTLDDIYKDIVDDGKLVEEILKEGYTISTVIEDGNEEVNLSVCYLGIEEFTKDEMYGNLKHFFNNVNNELKVRDLQLEEHCLNLKIEVGDI